MSGVEVAQVVDVPDIPSWQVVDHAHCLELLHHVTQRQILLVGTTDDVRQCLLVDVVDFTTQHQVLGVLRVLATLGFGVRLPVFHDFCRDDVPRHLAVLLHQSLQLGVH
ncbi:hypothetical protein D3C85_872740 [compost metagenome]